MKKEKKFICIVAIVVLIIIVYIIYLFLPKTILSAMGLDISDIEFCYILNTNGPSGHSTDFHDEELESLLQMLENTDVKFYDSIPTVCTPMNTSWYTLYFWLISGRNLSCMITSNGCLFYNRHQYTIIDTNNVDIVGFLVENVHNDS